MVYLDILRVAKNYNNIFYHTFSLRSFKEPYFIISMGCFALMLICAVLFVLASADYSWWVRGTLFVLMLVFELAGFIFKYYSNDKSANSRAKHDLQINTSNNDLSLYFSKIAWLSKKLEVPRESYAALVKSMEELEAIQDKQRKISSSLFDRYWGIFLKVPSALKWASTIVISASLPLFIKGYFENKDWYSYINKIVSLNNVYTVWIVFLAIMICGAAISLIATFVIKGFEYFIDVHSDEGCSPSGYARFKRDLLLLSKVDLEVKKDSKGNGET